MKFLCSLAAVAALLSKYLAAASSDDSKPLKPCTIRSPTSERFFDLNPISLKPVKDGDKKPKSNEKEESWQARGYDYPANFTINFCAPVVEEIKDVVGVEESLWKNVSAYYNMGGKTYSMGNLNTELVFRGRKLVLNYTDGSPCSPPSDKRSLHRHTAKDLPRREIVDGDDDDDDDDDDKPKKSGAPRKSTIVSLLCDKDPLAKQDEASVAFVAHSPDECTYFFEARSPAACGGVEVENQTLGPGGVFGVIFLIAGLAYLIGGVMYQRSVMHQRGWRQLPNYSLWAGIGRFIVDMFVILTSSCARFLPSRRGYNRVSLNGNGSGRGRNNHSDDENRLIDQLDEEWDD